MSSDKKPSREKTKKLPKEALLLSEKPLKEQQQYFGAVLEDIQNKMNRVIEATELTRDELRRDMSSMEERLTSRIETVEMAVRSHSTQLQNQSAQLQSQSTQIQQLDKKVDILQRDVTDIKQKLDPLIEKVDRHDEDIVFLKTAVAQG